MATVSVLNDKFVVHTEPREQSLAKQVPGLRWNPQMNAWSSPVSRANGLVLLHAFDKNLTVDAQFNEWAAADAAKAQTSMFLREQLDLSQLPDSWHGLADLVNRDERLMSFQRAGALFLATTGQALLADEMGSGKTLTTITALRVLYERGQEPFPVVIVCPNSVKRSWKREFETWWPDHTFPVVVIEGGLQKRKKLIDEAQGGVAIISWEGLRAHTKYGVFYGLKQKVCDNCTGEENGIKPQACERHAKELNEFAPNTVIADEAHRAKQAKSQQTRALWGVAQTAQFRFALTGTPIANHMGDLWSIMRFIAPDEYPSKSRFLDRYALMSWNPFGGMDIMGIKPDNRAEFDQLFLPRFRRMPKAITLPQLPPKVYETRYAEMKPAQAKAYKQAATELLIQLGDAKVFAGDQLVRLTRLSQFASAFATAELIGEDADGNPKHKITLTEPSNKIDALVDLLQNELPNEPIVVFARSRQLIELAAQRLEKLKITHRMITGSISTEDRQDAVEWFQDDNQKPGVILATIQAAGTGITLTRARYCVYLQRTWSLIDNMQSEDRIHRIGSEKHESVVYIDIVAPGTIDEDQIDAIVNKKESLEDLVRDKEALQRMLRK